jgi:hypothetical protein
MILKRIARPAVLAVLAVLLMAPKSSGGLALTIQVMDDTGSPVTTAVVRHPDEAMRHHVNAVTGSWSGTALYLDEGVEVPFHEGQDVTFEVSAPGFLTETVRYIVRKRRNTIVVTLSAMELHGDQLEDPLISFGRDKPIDGQPVTPAPE